MSTTGSQRDVLESELEKKLQSIIEQGHENTSNQLAEKLGLAFSTLKSAPIDVDVLRLLEESEARAGSMAVVYRSGTNIIVAAVDPTQPKTKESIEALTAKGFSVKTLITTLEALESIWKRYATFKEAETFEVGAIDINESDLEELEANLKDLTDLQKKLVSVSITKLLEILVAGALKTQASDIHLEPQEDTARLRYRLDGLLHDIASVDKANHKKIVSRVKILSKLKLNVTKSPQDGRFTIRQKGVDIEVRVSILPSEYGETIVMRLLDPRSIQTNLEELGMRPDILVAVKKQLDKPNGTILNTGPTGSGKTTSLYAFISYLNTPDVKIITLEDPIEYHIKGISQTQVNPSQKYSFADGLRSIVRQDPDVILIGEIRDFETADIALNAALTGHIVLSTIHTNDAAGAIPRLIDLGVKAEIIAPAISMAMAQRLLRRLCPNCKKETKLSNEELTKVKTSLEPLQKRLDLAEINANSKIYFAGKCDQCNQTGYKGRIGVYECFSMSLEMEKLILASPAISSVRELAIKEGMTTMLQDGYIKLLAGITSLEEIERVLGS